MESSIMVTVPGAVATGLCMGSIRSQMFVARNSKLSSNSVSSGAPDGASEFGGSISISRLAALGRAGRYRSRYCNGVKRPLASQLVNRPVEDIDIHVVFRAGN